MLAAIQKDFCSSEQLLLNLFKSSSLTFGFLRQGQNDKGDYIWQI